MSFIPGNIKKNITFIRLPLKNCNGYEVYAEYKDPSSSDGIRQEYVETIQNPALPSPVAKTIKLPYQDDLSWYLPNDIYLDRDHWFYISRKAVGTTGTGVKISSSYYIHNRVKKMVMLDKSAMSTSFPDMNVKDEYFMTYYRDVITWSHSFEENCVIKIKPLLLQSATYGDHNVII